MSNSLATTELAIYAVLAIPSIYLIFSHWPVGLLGWFYLFAFTSLRIVGGALSMNSTSSSASVISNIGLSPLLLAVGGILHEARIYRQVQRPRREWTFVILFHILVGSGVGLVGSGASALQSENATENDINLLKTGISLLVAAWFILCIWTCTALPKETTASGQAHRAGTTLLVAVIIALPFVGIRVFYSLVAITSHKSYLSPVNGSLALRVLLNFLPELMATLVLLGAGITTRKDASLRRENLRHQGRTSHDKAERRLGNG